MGLRAVVYADMVQGTWLIVCRIVLTVVAFGRWSGLTAPVDPGLLHMVHPLDYEFPVTVIGNLFGGVLYWCMNQTSVQRVLGARSVDQGQSGAIFTGILKLLVPFILVLAGCHRRCPLSEPSEAGMAYPRLVSDLLFVGLCGLVLRTRHHRALNQDDDGRTWRARGFFSRTLGIARPICGGKRCSQLGLCLAISQDAWEFHETRSRQPEEAAAHLDACRRSSYSHPPRQPS
jgi:Sodium:solute symporter family